MFRFGSLKTRIIVLTTIPLSALFVGVLAGTIHTANNSVRKTIGKSLSDAASVFVQLVSTRKDALLTTARVTARDPRFFATFSIPENERGEEFGPTLAGVSRDFLHITDADFLEVFDPHGALIAAVDKHDAARSIGAPFGSRGLAEAMRGQAVTDIYATNDNLVVAAIAPVYVAGNLEAVLRFSSFLDHEFVQEVKRLTRADVSLVASRRELATTFPEAAAASPVRPWTTGTESALSLGQGSVALSEPFTAARTNTDYLAVRVRLVGLDPSDHAEAYMARELRTELAPLVAFEQRMAVAGILAIIVTVLAGFFLANGITGPLRRVVQAATALQQGDYNYALAVSGSDEVAFLGRSFEDMRQALQQHVAHLQGIDQVKSNFIAMASHELRTPLTIISGFNEMIMTGALGEIPDKIKETTQHIQQQLTDLNTLVQKMLDLSSFEQGTLELNKSLCDLRELVANAVDNRRSALEARKLRVTCDVPDDAVCAEVDWVRLEQAFLNLLDNAIRFTPDHGSITVTLRESDHRAYLTVKDTGVGIPPNEQKWIFEKLYETGDVLHHSSGKHRFGSRGFGLGLALSKSLVEKHGGQIVVKSTLGRGSEFTIVLGTIAGGPQEREEIALITHAQEE